MRPGKGLFRASYAVRYRGVAPGIGSLIEGRETLAFLFAPVSDAITLRMPTWIAR